MTNYQPHASAVATTLNLTLKQVTATLQLLEEGATVPFIARYRKDHTGNLDEVQIQQILDTAKATHELEERRAFISKTIEEQGKLTQELAAAIAAATQFSTLEDLYLPYKPKRKTKAQAAREKGLAPLADLLLAQQHQNLEVLAASYLNEQVTSTEDALQGARDIVAEQISEDAEVRAAMRKLFEKQGELIAEVVTGKEEEGQKFKDYFNYAEPLSKAPAHRILAVLRGFMEGHLRMRIEPAETEALHLLEHKVIKKPTASEAQHLQKAVKDAYKRLLQPSLESEFRMALKQKADEEAIAVFAENLRQLLLGSPLGGKALIAIDPGYRTGCKTVVLDSLGNLQHNTVIYVHEANRLTQAEHTLRQLVHQYHIEAIAVGDGTAGRETEQFVKKLQLGLPVFLVNEDGASIYSASEVAREEFPNEDVTVRGAVSIGRRLMDPLAELVKIDPKSIGVGQYQHDVNQTRLKEKLDQTVESCVNQVGVNLNTASRHLLSYVSGIGPSLAKNIVDYRTQTGPFKSRQQLLQVPRLGEKAFEQCAGFLRIPQAEQPLDNSAVHPESYELVAQIAADLQVTVDQLAGNEALLNKVQPQRYAQHGLHRVQDIIKELKKPGLDPRQGAEAFEFAAVYAITDLQVGMELPGIVTNLTRFGAFIDVGVKQDGLVHVSEIAHRYISDPAEALKLGQKVRVKVLEVDAARKRVALSIKQTEAPQGSRQHSQPNASRPKNTPRPQMQQQAGTMQDALAALKRKFGK